MNGTDGQFEYVRLPFDDVRIKLNTICNWSCLFCHQEGNHDTDNLRWSTELETTLTSFRDDLLVKEVHLTGGEPSLHPKIVEFIQRLYRFGFEIHMTSNGTFKQEMIPILSDAGLSGINISLLSVDPAALARMHTPPRTIDWAMKQIAAATDNIRLAKNEGLETKINCTISSNSDQWKDVLAFAESENIVLRFQNDLYSPDAIPALRSIISQTRGKLIRVTRRLLTSRVSYVYVLPSGFQLGIKLIIPTELSTMCASCLMKAECREWFYALRLEPGSPLNVRLCLHRTDASTLIPSTTFIASAQYLELKSQIGTLSANLGVAYQKEQLLIL